MQICIVEAMEQAELEDVPLQRTKAHRDLSRSCPRNPCTGAFCFGLTMGGFCAYLEDSGWHGWQVQLLKLTTYRSKPWVAPEPPSAS